MSSSLRLSLLPALCCACLAFAAEEPMVGAADLGALAGESIQAAALPPGLPPAAPRPVAAPLTPVCHAADESLPANFSIAAGQQETLTLSGTITRVAIGDPATADITVIDPRTLLLQGRKAGETSLMVWTPCSGKPQRMLVKVPAAPVVPPAPPPPTAAQALMKLPPEVAAVLPSQIQADIRFVELSRSRLLDLGTRLQGNRGTGLFSSPTAGGNSTVTPGLMSGVGFPLDAGAFNIVWGGGSSRFLSAINLLEQNGYAYTLSQPSLVAMSGQSAYFLAGGEVPIPVPQGGLGAVGIEYKEFGVRLTLTPTVVSKDQILLKVAPEVSDLDFTNAVTIQGSTIPALRIRRTDTTISLADGESFIISGLVGRSTVSNVGKLPGLGDLPVLGAFFRSTRFQTDDRELLMIVTPRLVKPLKAGTALSPLPGDAARRLEPSAGELLWQGAPSPYRATTPIGYSR